MGEQPEFDLGIIRCQQKVPGLGDKSGAYLSPKFGAYWNILQVRIGGRQPSRRRSSLPESRMHSATMGANQSRQRIHISGLQLRQLPVIENESWNFVLGSQPFQYIHRGRYFFALPIFNRNGECELLEEHISQLLRRVDIELHAAALIDVA